jgi:uncharacterized Zn finger protein (UPF0148 family)
MRELITRYDGECKKCGAALAVGVTVMYEKSMGVFCPGCEPKDVEEIREYRTMKAEIKAARYEGWAEKREEKATAALNSYPSLRHDWAFITQPGHIPARARMNAADDRAHESLQVARGMRERASGILNNVRVAGDAERNRQAKREALDRLIGKGSRVRDLCFGDGEVIGVYSKSYRIRFDRGYTYSLDKSYIRPLTA